MALDSQGIISRYYSIPLLLFVLLFVGSGLPVQAADISVNDTCSLSDAIKAANTDIATGGCPAGSGADTITLTGDVSFWQTLPSIESEITIEGGYHRITTQPRNLIFYIDRGGSLHLNQARLSKSSGSGMRSGWGGLIANSGTLRVTNSTFSNGYAQQGGAIVSGHYGAVATLIVENSFFNRNRASDKGGAIRVINGSASITNSTFSGNSAGTGGAIYKSTYQSNTLRIKHVTMWANSAEANSSALHIENRGGEVVNSIIGGATSGNDCSNTSGIELVNTYSESCAATSNSGGLDSTDGSPNLGALVIPADGSPGYYPLLGGSVALGAGAAAHCLATDQVGNARPNPGGGNCDIGAVEAGANPPTVTLTSTATNTSTPTHTQTPTKTPTLTPTLAPGSITVSGSCSLADAIRSANENRAVAGCSAGGSVDTITLTEDISLSSSLPRVTSDIIIDGNYHDISARPSMRIFYVAASGNLQLNQVRLSKTDKNVQMNGVGGLVFNDGRLRVSGSTFSNSFARGGGAIANDLGAQLTIDGSFFRGNRAWNIGGAVSNASSATITNSTFTDNTSRRGGAVGNYYTGAVTNIKNVTMWANTALDFSASVFNDYSRVVIANSIMGGSNVAECGDGRGIEVITSFSDSCVAADETDVIGSADGPVRLGALVEPADGSPAYFPLQDGSSALSRGDPAHCPAKDQLGNARPNPAGANCDLGAVESNAMLATITPTPTDTLSPTITLTPTDTLTPTVTQTPTDTLTPTITLTPTNAPAGSLIVNNSCSLADAIRAANTDTATGGCSAGSGDDLIILTGDISVSSTLPNVTSTIRIDGHYHDITASPQVRIFYVAQSGNLHLNQVRLSKTDKTVRMGGVGGLVRNDGRLTVTGSTFKNSSAGSGAAIFSDYGSHLT